MYFIISMADEIDSKLEYYELETLADSDGFTAQPQPVAVVAEVVTLPPA
jgi:hypothetical protein